MIAQFLLADTIRKKNEGGYANKKNDKGGMTLNGIAYNSWPQWHGWIRLAAIKAKVGENVQLINAAVKKDTVLIEMIDTFFFQNFFITLNQITDSQIINNVYDFRVNSGVGRANKYMQRAVNMLNNNKGLTEDGDMGPKTYAAINKLNPKTLYDLYNELRESFYRESAKVEGQEEFLDGWLKRLTPYKTQK